MDNRQHSKKTAKGQDTNSFRSARFAEMLDPVRSYMRSIANALNPSYFQGFEDDDVAAHKRVARRRAKNRVARRSRRINRKAAQR